MTNKINGVCTACGKGFTTLKAARRHVATVEHGAGQAVSEAAYRMGLQTGLFVPSLPGRPPKFEFSRKSRGKPPIVIERDEYFRGFWFKAGELHCEELFRDPKGKEFLAKEFQRFTIEWAGELQHEAQEDAERSAARREAWEASKKFNQMFGGWYKRT